MSKTQLKKELVRLSSDQLIELIVDLYESRKEAKDYLDFYVNPDIDKRLDKARTAIAKEIARKSRGYIRMRMTRLRGYIKDIATLNPGPEAVLDIMLYTLERMCTVGSTEWIKETTQLNCAKLLTQTISYADRNGMLSECLSRLNNAIGGMTTPLFRTNGFKKLLKETLTDAVESIGA